MNHAQTREAIAVMRGWLVGKAVQVRSRGENEWITLKVAPPSWDWHEAEYRIAPEPMEIEVWVSPHEELSFVEPHSIGNLIWTKKTFREVL